MVQQNQIKWTGKSQLDTLITPVKTSIMNEPGALVLMPIAKKIAVIIPVLCSNSVAVIKPRQ
jgi:hypothetical protein